MTNLQSTRWTLVVRAGGAKTHDARRALNELCGMYRGTLLAYARRFLHDPAGAEDAVQAFLERFVKKDMAGTADPARGSFRAYLRASLRNFLLNLVKSQSLPSHGGDVEFVSEDEAVIPDTRTPDRFFDRLWMEALLDRAIERLGEEETRAGRRARFEALKDRLVGEEAPLLAQTARELGAAEGTIRVALHRLRRRHHAILREEVAETVGRAELVDHELEDLLATLSEVP